MSGVHVNLIYPAYPANPANAATGRTRRADPVPASSGANRELQVGQAAAQDLPHDQEGQGGQHQDRQGNLPGDVAWLA